MKIPEGLHQAFLIAPQRLKGCCRLACLVLVSGLAAFGQTAAPVGQGPTGTQAQHPAAHRSSRMTIDDRVKLLARGLALSEAQEVQVKRILEQRQQQMLEIRQDTSVSGSARIDRFRALQDQTVEQIRAVLDDQQRKKYDPLAARRVQQQQQGPTVEEWMEATTPH